MNDELRSGFGAFAIPLILGGVLIGFFMLIPLGIMTPISWTSGQLLEFPPKGFSLKWYREIFSDDTWTGPARTSLSNALRASLVATVMGTATALGMRRLAQGRSVRFMRSAFILPMAIPYVSYALGVYHMVFRIPGDWRSNSIPLILAQATITFPLVYVIVAGALAAVDPRLSSAASTMGARWPMIVWRVELPLIRMAVLGGWVFAFATCFEEATLAIFLTPIRERTFAQQLFRETSESIDPTVAAVSTLVTIAAITVLGLASFIISRGAARRGRER